MRRIVTYYLSISYVKRRRVVGPGFTPVIEACARGVRMVMWRQPETGVGNMLKTCGKLFQNAIPTNYSDRAACVETVLRARTFQFYRKPRPTGEIAKSSGYAAKSAIRPRGIVLGWYGVALSCCIALLTQGWVWAGFVIIRVSRENRPSSTGVEDETQKTTPGPAIPRQVLSRSREGSILSEGRRLCAAALHFPRTAPAHEGRGTENLDLDAHPRGPVSHLLSHL